MKADINFWKEDLGSDKPSLDFSALLALLSEHEIEIAESTLDSSSEEVSTTIAGYIAKKLAHFLTTSKQSPLILRGRTLLSRSRNAKEPNNWFSFIAVLCFCYPELLKCLVTLFVCSLL